MRTGLLLLANALLLAGVGCGADPRAKAELAALQGVWQVVNDDGTIDSHTHYEITGDRMKMVSVDSVGKRMEIERFKMQMRPGHTPAQIDLETPGVPPVSVRRTWSYTTGGRGRRFVVEKHFSAAIYKLEGDTLTICMGNTTGDRPTAFDPAAHPRSLVLRRAGGVGEGR